MKYYSVVSLSAILLLAAVHSASSQPARTGASDETQYFNENEPEPSGQTSSDKPEKPEENPSAGERRDEKPAVSQEKQEQTKIEEERPPGFHNRSVLFAIMGGPTLQAAGSFINHEKSYDQALRVQSLLGNVPIKLLDATLPGPTFSFKYLPKTIGSMDYERGLFNHLGLGMNVYHFSLLSSRQDVKPGFRYSAAGYVRQDYVDPFPTENRLFQGTGGLLQVVLHPLTRNSIDPYLAVRAGFVGFSGTAHNGLTYDPTRVDYKIHNGVGYAGGAALGVNLFFGSRFGLKMETTFLRQALKSDLFSNRSLNTYHFQVGFFFNSGGE